MYGSLNLTVNFFIETDRGIYFLNIANKYCRIRGVDRWYWF